MTALHSDVDQAIQNLLNIYDNNIGYTETMEAVGKLSQAVQKHAPAMKKPKVSKRCVYCGTIFWYSEDDTFAEGTVGNGHFFRQIKCPKCNNQHSSGFTI